jgi:hypothetical protein
MMKTPLIASQFKEEEFDFSLNFLDGFIQEKLQSGRKAYDPKRRQVYVDPNAIDLLSAGKELNFKPYVTPAMARGPPPIVNEL